MKREINVQTIGNAVNKRLYWIPLALLILWTVFPLLWGFSASFKTYAEVYQVPPRILPRTLNLRAYNVVLESRHFFTYVYNSAYLAITSSIIAVFVSVLAGYGFAKYKFRFAGILLLLILIPRIIPRASLIIPLFQMMSALRLLNSYPALMITYTATAIPLNTMVLTGFFRGIPQALEDAASIDGAKLWQRIWYIIIPMSLPALVTVSVMSLREAWNEFPFVLALTTATRMRTLPYQLFMLRDAMGIEDWPVVLAFTVFTIVPILTFYLIFQKKVTSGLVSGAIK
ncbi:MAG: carbohydrate ABC transporter permease [Spirochaetaceae bacterium]|nr:MAG: carbohydrate ABC transporter permease [Spirochaetaceae bacterium]